MLAEREKIYMPSEDSNSARGNKFKRATTHTLYFQLKFCMQMRKCLISVRTNESMPCTSRKVVSGMHTKRRCLCSRRTVCVCWFGSEALFFSLFHARSVCREWRWRASSRALLCRRRPLIIRLRAARCDESEAFRCCLLLSRFFSLAHVHMYQAREGGGWVQ